MSTGASRVDSLTSLRFLAAGLVAYQHAASPAFFGDGIHVLDTRQAVSFFFVLSGFILSHAYGDREPRKGLRDFWASRIARLWPAHLATAALALAVVVPLSDVGILKAAVNALMLQSLVPLIGWYYSVNAVSWSISTEMFFYLAFPFVLPYVRRWPSYALICSVLIVVVSVSAVQLMKLSPVETSPGVTAWGFLYISPLVRFAEFLGGMAAYQMTTAYAEQSRGWSRSRSSVGEMVAALTVVASMVATTRLAELLTDFAPHASVWIRVAGSYLVFGGMLVVLHAQRGALSDMLRWRPLVYLGEISFSVYLVHQLVLRWMFNSYRGVIEEHAELGYVLYWMCTIVLSIALYHLVENPMRRVLKRILAKPASAVGSAQAA